MAPDPNVEKVIDLIRQRSEKAIEEYKTDTTREDYSLSDWLDEIIWESIDRAVYAIAAKNKSAPLKLCPAHLYIRFCCGDYLFDTDVRITHVMVEEECIDCEAYAKGELDEMANPDPIMKRWRD